MPSARMRPKPLPKLKASSNGNLMRNKPERFSGKGEHTRLACGVWRPAKHSYHHICLHRLMRKSQPVEVLAETARTARGTRALPKNSCTDTDKSLYQNEERNQHIIAQH